jgi:hypothetical protein
MFLATAALLAILILAPMALAKGTTVICIDYCSSPPNSYFSGTQILADGGGPTILLPAAALLLGSAILTYAILRRG